MDLTRKQLSSSFALAILFQIFLTNFATCLQATSFAESEKRKLAEEEFGNKTLAQDESLFQASGNSLSATGDDAGDKSNKYYYIGGAVIGVVIILLIIMICCCCSRRKKEKEGKKKKKKESQKSLQGASTSPPVNIFEPLDLEVTTNSDESSIHQANIIYALSPVEVHHSNDNDHSYKQNVPHTSSGYSTEPQDHVANHDVVPQRTYYGNETDQQMGYSAPFQISDEENLQGQQKYKHEPKYKHEVQSKHEPDGREFYGRKDSEITRNHEAEENYRVPPTVYPVPINPAHRKTNYYEDDRVGMGRYDSVERKMNPPPPVAPKPRTSRKLSDKETEYRIQNEEYHRNNVDKPYPYSVHQKRVSDRMDRYPEQRYQSESSRPQSLYLEDQKHNSSYKTKQSGSFIKNDYYSDKQYDRNSSITSQKVSTSNNLRREDFNSSYKENITTKKDIPIPDPDYISQKTYNTLEPHKESDEEKTEITRKPSIKKRDFKGPYGPDDLDDMYNPLTMAMRYKNRARVPFEVDDD